MAEYRKEKYYWLKLKEDFFKRHDIKIIKSMPNGKDYVIFYLQLLCESLSHSGNLRFNEFIPYDENMLATVTDTDIDVVRSAMKILKQLGMVEILDDKTIYMTELDNMIGSTTFGAERKQEQRARKSNNLLQGGQKVDKCPPEIDIEIEIEKDIDINNNNIMHGAISESTVQEQEKKEKQEQKTIVQLILNDKSFYNIYEPQIDHWQELYAAVDIKQELLKMQGWLESNASRRKTRRGIERFITNWLAKAQDRGGSVKSTVHQGSAGSAKEPKRVYADGWGDT